MPTASASRLYSAMIRRGKQAQASVNSAAMARAIHRFTRKLRRIARSFPCPRYWASITPATAPTDDASTPWIDANLPARPTPATQALPNRPIMI